MSASPWHALYLVAAREVGAAAFPGLPNERRLLLCTARSGPPVVLAFQRLADAEELAERASQGGDLSSGCLQLLPQGRASVRPARFARGERFVLRAARPAPHAGDPERELPPVSAEVLQVPSSAWVRDHLLGPGRLAACEVQEACRAPRGREGVVMTLQGLGLGPTQMHRYIDLLERSMLL
jgi:hypothetical protein